MVDCRDGDAGRVEVEVRCDKLRYGGKAGDVVLLRGGLSSRRIEVDYGDEGDGLPRGFEFAEDAKVVAAEGSGADDRYTRGG